MSVEDVRAKLEKLLSQHPDDLRFIRSASEVNEVELMNADLNGPFDNGDLESINTIERALASGKQVAIQAAGPKKVLILTAKSGKKLFGTKKDPKHVASGTIMDKLEQLHKRYIDSRGEHLLVGGLDSYIYPEKFAGLAQKYNFTKYRSFSIDDESLIDEVRRHLENNKMVVVAAWGKEERVDVYLEPTYSSGSVPAKSGGCFIATATYGSPLAPEVIIFRRFRDEVLLVSKSGTRLVQIYYWASPPLAKIISKVRFLRVAIKHFLLEPLLRLLKNTFHAEG